MVTGNPFGLQVPAAVWGAAADVGDPPAAVVLVAGCTALAVGHPGRKSNNITIFAMMFWEVPLVATEVSDIFAEGGSSLRSWANPRRGQPVGKKSLVSIFGAAEELRNIC